MSSRANRRRKRRSTTEDAPPPQGGLLGRTERIAIAFLGIGIVLVAIVGLIVLASTDGDGGSEAIDDDILASGTTTASTAQSGTAISTSTGSAQDVAGIEALARRSIEVLPAGQWPSLYDDFTAEFRGRCDLAVFTQAGVDSAAALGESLRLLEFKELKELAITGDAATGIIVGRSRGVEGSDYDIQAAFAREDGRWKLAPAPGTTGCSAFNQLRA